MESALRLIWIRWIAGSIAALGIVSVAWCDTFTVREDDGNLVAIDARLAGQGQGAVALERRDGRIEIVPLGQIVNRQPGNDPEPLTCTEMVERLTAKFGAEKFRARSDSPHVVGLVLSEPLPKAYEPKATACLKKGAGFMKKVDTVFLDFMKELKIVTDKPRYPLVLLIFETDDDFVKYAAEDTGGKGLSAGSILGYYNGLSNQLAIRMSECYTFETPLHEAIHQQVFNRGVIQRLSPVPVWFSEGIATGFQGNGEKISIGPTRVNTRYARGAMRARAVDWDDVVADDKAFRGDVLASEAYSHAWSIHWFLVTKYRKKYVEYLRLLGDKPALQIDSAQTRTDDFEKIFDKSVGKLQSEFPQWLEQSIKKQDLSLDEKIPVGELLTQSNLAEVHVMAAASESGGTVAAEGRMNNMSHLRPMSFYITFETNSGMYAEWYLPQVPTSKQVTLPRQIAQKKMKGAPGGFSKSFRIKVKVAVPDSETGQAWQRGQLPAPIWSEN